MSVEDVTGWQRERPSFKEHGGSGWNREHRFGGHLCENLGAKWCCCSEEATTWRFSWGSLSVVDKQGTTAA